VFKGITGLGTLMKQAQEITGRMQGLNEELRVLRATGSAGGGMVEIEVNGLMDVLRCHIDEGLIAQGDRELIEDLVQSAVSQAIAKGKQLHAEALKSLTGGLELPGLDDMMGKFLGKNASETPPSEAT
jgi:hypothetical protein